MNMHDATEQAYKNGFNNGVEIFAKRIKEEMKHTLPSFSCIQFKTMIDKIVNEIRK